MTAIAVPSTVTVAASPRDMWVFAITKRTGYSNTSARKMPMKTIRNMSPIERKAAMSADGGGDDDQRPHGKENLGAPDVGPIHPAECRKAIGRTSR